MKLPLRSLLAALAFATAAFSPLSASAAEKTAEATVKRHPLRGVITGIMAERSAILVRHEEIPGVMRAMTMMFKVDAATLNAVKGGQTITGLMSRQGDAWVLEEVKIVAEKQG